MLKTANVLSKINSVKRCLLTIYRKNLSNSIKIFFKTILTDNSCCFCIFPSNYRSIFDRENFARSLKLIFVWHVWLFWRASRNIFTFSLIWLILYLSPNFELRYTPSHYFQSTKYFHSSSPVSSYYSLQIYTFL